MAAKFQYTTLAHRYTARFPAITYIGIQINFWMVANMLLVTIVHLSDSILSELHATPVATSLGTLLAIAVASGFLYGAGLGFTNYNLDKTIFKKLPLGKTLIFKALIAVVLLAVVLLVLRFSLFDRPTDPSRKEEVMLTRKTWDYLFYLLLVYYFFMTLIINFINQVNKKYGPGVLVPLLLGRYRTPKEEERIFMFMDLKSSTSTAEKLGHLKYSSFIRDCFADVNEILYPYYAQVYQYVGDEIVITWPMSEGLKNDFCLHFYFAVKKQFLNRSKYYLSTYGFIPVFKAGLHMGLVTAVEIGEIKKDIAYHGDTLNTTARIQSICNEYQKELLVSETLVKRLTLNDRLRVQHLGGVLLKGKSRQIEIVSIEEV